MNSQDQAICHKCGRRCIAGGIFFKGSDGQLRNFTTSLPGDKALCLDCATKKI